LLGVLASRSGHELLGHDKWKGAVADFKLFRVGASATAEIPARSAQVGKSLQTLFEANLEALLGVLIGGCLRPR
jgi:hypothetical protein